MEFKNTLETFNDFKNKQQKCMKDEIKLKF